MPARPLRSGNFRVRSTRPCAVKTAESSAILKESEQQNLNTIGRTYFAKGNGRERIDNRDVISGNEEREVQERDAAMQRYIALEGLQALEKYLKKAGPIPKYLRDAIARVKKVRAPIGTIGADDFKLYTYSSTSLRCFAAANNKRVAAAKQAAKALNAGDAAALDVSDNNLGALSHVKDKDLRASMLMDAVLQFMADRRTDAMIDSYGKTEQERVANDMGRLPTSGPIAILELQKMLQGIGSGTSSDAEREFALARLATVHHPVGALSSMYLSRQANIGLAKFNDFKSVKDVQKRIEDELHTLYSADSPNQILRIFRDKVFVKGADEDWREIFGTCYQAMRAETPEEAKRLLEGLGASTGVKVPASGRTVQGIRKAIARYLRANSALTGVGRLSADDQVRLFSELGAIFHYGCVAIPSDASLVENLGSCGAAKRDVASFVHKWRHGSNREALAESGDARAAMRKAFGKLKSGHERQLLLLQDRQLEHVQTQLLGEAVKRAEAASKRKDPQGLDELMWAARSGLQSAIASGLHELRQGARTSTVPDLEALLRRVDALLKKPSYTAEDARALMADVARSTEDVLISARHLIDDRRNAIYFDGVDVSDNPLAPDHLLKESALHYLLALGQTGADYGRTTKVEKNKITFQAGFKVLSPIGRAVFDRVVHAKDMQELARIKPAVGPNDLCFVDEINVKDKMLAVGGLVVADKHAPAGYSHPVVFAKGTAASVIAVPNVRKEYLRIAKRSKDTKAPGVYYDDRQGQFSIMARADALACGELTEAETPALRQRRNIALDYIDFVGRAWESHELFKDIGGGTLRRVEFYRPDLTNRWKLPSVLTMDALAKLPLSRRRHVAGEKATVYAHLSNIKELKKLGANFLDGVAVPTYTLAGLLKDTKVAGQSLFDRITALWEKDRDVGNWNTKDPKSKKYFTESAFYSDPTHREQQLDALRKDIDTHLLAALVDNGKPTAAGQKLLAGIRKSRALKSAIERVIGRSSVITEDRPYASGAGQYESPKTPKRRSGRNDADILEVVVKALSSTWNDDAVGNAVRRQVNVEHMWPSILMQPFLEGITASGVAESRGPEGQLGEVSYRAAAKPGCTVDAKESEVEVSHVDRDGVGHTEQHARGRRKPLLDAKQQATLREVTLRIEQEFNEVLEPGRHHSVELEWAIAGGKLHILQARVITHLPSGVAIAQA